MSGNLEIREGDSNETVRAGQDLETIWSNPEMLSDLPSIAQQALGFDPALSTFPFFGGFLFFCFFLVLGTGVLQDGGSDWPSSMGRWGKGSNISGMEWRGEGSVLKEV